MADALKLLQQVRRAAATAVRVSNNAECTALLSAADVALNTLMLQQKPKFYLQHIAAGRALLTEGEDLIQRYGRRVAPAVQSTARDVFDNEIVALNQSLVEIVASLDESRSAVEKSFLIRVSEWESSLYLHHLEQVADALASTTKTLTPQTLQAYLRNRFPERKQLKVTQFMPLAGGFSKNTILFETTDALTGTQAMVIRAEQAVDLLRYEGSDVTQEFPMIQLMRAAGLPIAEPLWLESDSNHLGARFIVSRKAEGKTFGGNLGSDEALSAELVQSMLATFVKMHNIRIDPNDALTQRSHLKEWLPHRTVRAAILHGVNVFLPRLIRLTDITPSPLLMRGVKWLQRNVPNCDEPPVVVHIDFALNNLIIDNNRITAVLDWESSRFGDPADDIFWTQQNIGAYISLAEFLKLYKAGTGRDISEYRMAYARVYRCAMNAVTCMSAMRALDQHDSVQINSAILAYKYLAIFGTQFNDLIAAAEKLRP